MPHKCWIAELPNEIMFDIIYLACLPGIYPLCPLDHATYRHTPTPPTTTTTASEEAPSPIQRTNVLSPLDLAIVCRTWRNLVFSTRNLWTSFSIYAKNPNLPRIHRHLELSGPTIPLSIRLFANDTDGVIPDDSTRDAIFTAMAVIDQNLFRIAYLCLDLPETYFKTLVSESSITSEDDGSRRILPESAPILKEFHVHNRCRKPRHVDFKLCAIPPRPYLVSISGFVSPKVHVDWLQVTYLILTARKSSSASRSLEILDLFSTAKSLIEFKTNISTTQYLTRTLPIMHDSIRKVNIYVKGPSFLIFANTTMPSLESLVVHEFCLSPSIIRVFPTFLQRSASPLTSVELSFIKQTTGEDLISIFQHTPMVQDLTLAFTSERDNELILPFLRRLSGQWPLISQVINNPVGQVPLPRDILLPQLQKFHHESAWDLVSGAPSLAAFLDIMENRDKMIETRQIKVAVVEELVIHVTSVPTTDGSGRSANNNSKIVVSEENLNRVLALRKANKTVSVSGWFEPNRETVVDFVEESMMKRQRQEEQHLSVNSDPPDPSQEPDVGQDIDMEKVSRCSEPNPGTIVEEVIKQQQQRQEEEQQHLGVNSDPPDPSQEPDVGLGQDIDMDKVSGCSEPNLGRVVDFVDEAIIKQQQQRQEEEQQHLGVDCDPPDLSREPGQDIDMGKVSGCSEPNRATVVEEAMKQQQQQNLDVNSNPPDPSQEPDVVQDIDMEKQEI